MMRISDVVRHLLIINVLAFLASRLLGEPSFGVNIVDNARLGYLRLAMFYPSSPFFEPYQIVTHMFMHADMGHLFFNMIGLFFFGPPLEYRFGPKRFLIYYLIAGLGGLLLHIFVKFVQINYLGYPLDMQNIPMLGASGAIMGLLVGYAVIFPNNIISLIFPPISMKAKYFVLIFIAIDLFGGFGRFDSSIAHFAHLGGALFGFLLIQYWRKSPSGLI